MLFTAQAWRERAKQARTQAERVADPASKHLMLSIAATYDRFADKAEHTESIAISTQR